VLLAPAVPELRARHPALRLEITADQRAFDLSRREADLALRMGRPRDAGLVIRKLSDVAHRVYAAKGSEAARRGEPDFAHDDFIGFDETLAGTPQERWLSKVAPGRRVVFCCNNTSTLLAATGLGVGLAVLPCFAADREPGLVCLGGPEPVNHELWLVVHGDLRRTPRVKAIIEWLDAIVARERPGLCRAEDG
jgi:DNA-binding transcriptional LysR family regulator